LNICCELKNKNLIKGVVYCFFFSLHDYVYGVQYNMYLWFFVFKKSLFFINFNFIVRRFLLCHLNDQFTS